MGNKLGLLGPIETRLETMPTRNQSQNIPISGYRDKSVLNIPTGGYRDKSVLNIPISGYRERNTISLKTFPLVARETQVSPPPLQKQNKKQKKQTRKKEEKKKPINDYRGLIFVFCFLETEISPKISPPAARKTRSPKTLH